MANAPGGIDEIKRRPVVIGKRVPHRRVAVDGDRIVDAHFSRGSTHVVDVVFEAELRCMNAEDNQSPVAVFLTPGTDIRQLAQPVDAGERPEIDEHHLAAQGVRRQRWRIQPVRGAVK
jgi:hypothetical protein